MACEFTVYLNAGQHEEATEHALSALDLVEQLEDQLTVYRDHSEISVLNRTAGSGPVSVNQGLRELLERGQDIFRDTGGAFDMTAGPLSKLWGFHRREGRLPKQAEIEKTLEQVGGQHVRLDSDAGTIQFSNPNVELNLGGIGKGYALDRSRELLLDNEVDDFLIHGGHSSVLGCGNRMGKSKPGWQVNVRHPLRPDRVLAEIYLRDQALGTSGSAVQSFQHQGKRYGHIIDPRTGWPAEEMLSSTVIAPTAAQSDALATAFYVGGVDLAEAYCEKHPNVAAVLIRKADRAGDVEVVSFGMSIVEWVAT